MEARRTRRHTTPIPSLLDALRLFRRVLVLLRPVWLRVVRVSSIGLVVATIGLVTPLFSKLLLDEVYPARDVNLLVAVLVGMAVTQLASAALGTFQGFVSFLISTEVNRQAELMFLNHLQHLPVSFYDRHRVGEVTSRFSDVRGAIGAGMGLLSSVLLRLLNYALVPPILLLLNPTLCLVALAPVPLTSAVSLIAGRMIRKASKESAEVMADANAYRIEVLSRIRTLKSLGLEPEIANEYRAQLRDAYVAQVRGRAISAWSGLLNALIRACGRIALAWFGWSAVLADDMTLGGYMAFMAYIGYVTGPVGQMLSAFGSLQHLAVSLARAFEYLDEEPEQDPAEVFQPVVSSTIVLSGRVHARGLRFAYGDGPTVLHDVDFELEPGERIAVVGANGSGKSTLLRILGLIDPPSGGRLVYDGRDARSIPLRALRRQIMFVWQEPGLMRGSIRENVMLGVPPEREELLEEAIALCGLVELVAGLSDGVDTPIAEMGATLSGGQRQRLALARAFLAGRPLLLLDEATANIDVMSEMRILEALFTGSGSVTAVYVTHRMAAASVADRIVCLDEGRVVGAGTHAALASSCPTYAALAASGGVGGDGLIPIESRAPAERGRHGRAGAR